ncbi:MAG: nicotinamide-nucleotide amidohydrolase family protein, partial [Elusimicrobiota bacterium]
DVVIVTGGLGPTFDDITRQAVSKALDRKLIFSRELLSTIARFFVEKGTEMPKNNESQAYLIEGAKPILNKTGTAPGQIIELDKPQSVIILLPGPTKEMHPMMEGTVLPYLKEKYEKGILKKKTLHIYGLPESKIDELIRPVVNTERKIEGGTVKFTILEHTSIIDVSFSVSGKDELLVEDIIRKIKSELLNVLGKHVFGEDQQTLESITAELLLKKRKTISVAESCTGGHLANRITNIPGSSTYFKMGIDAYSNEAKIEVLGVSAETIEKYGAASVQTALEMARGMLKLSKSDIAISVTGIAGPGGGTPEIPVGTVYFAVVFATPEGRRPSEPLSEKQRFYGSRFEIKEKASSHALFILRNYLL